MSSSTISERGTSPPEPLFVLKADMTSVHCLLFANFAGEDHLYVGTADGSLHIWNLQTNRRTKIIKLGENPCLSIHVIDCHLITHDKSGLVKLWRYNAENFVCLHSENFNNLSFCKISVLEKNQCFVAIPQPNSKINVYTIEENRLKPFNYLEFTELNGKKLGEVLVLKLITVHDVVYLASMYESGILIFWNCSKKIIASSHQITNDTPMCFDFDTENLQGVCGSSANSLIIFKIDVELMNIIKKKEITITNPGTGSLCIRPDRKILAAGCWDGKIRIFSWKNLKLLAVLDYHRETILDVKFSDNNYLNKCNFLLAAGSSDKKVSLWNIYN